MCILKQPFIGLCTFSPQRPGGGSSWCSVRVRRGSWGGLSVCLLTLQQWRLPVTVQAAEDSPALLADAFVPGPSSGPRQVALFCLSWVPGLPQSKPQRGNDITGSEEPPAPVARAQKPPAQTIRAM